MNKLFLIILNHLYFYFNLIDKLENQIKYNFKMFINNSNTNILNFIN